MKLKHHIQAILNVFPNPVNTDLITLVYTFSREVTDQLKIEITSLNGELVKAYEKQVGSSATGQLELPIKDIANGAYLIKLTHRGETFVERLVISD